MLTKRNHNCDTSKKTCIELLYQMHAVLGILWWGENAEMFTDVTKFHMTKEDMSRAKYGGNL